MGNQHPILTDHEDEDQHNPHQSLPDVVTQAEVIASATSHFVWVKYAARPAYGLFELEQPSFAMVHVAGPWYTPPVQEVHGDLFPSNAIGILGPHIAGEDGGISLTLAMIRSAASLCKTCLPDDLANFSGDPWPHLLTTDCEILLHTNPSHCLCCYIPIGAFAGLAAVEANLDKMLIKALPKSLLATYGLETCKDVDELESSERVRVQMQALLTRSLLEGQDCSGHTSKKRRHHLHHPLDDASGCPCGCPCHLYLALARTAARKSLRVLEKEALLRWLLNEN